jgi:hypothetical protein
MDFTQALSLTRPTEQTYGMQGHYMQERVRLRTAARERFAAMYYKKEGDADDLTLWFDPESTTADPVRAGMGLEVKRAEVDDNGDFVNANAVVKALGKCVSLLTPRRWPAVPSRRRGGVLTLVRSN